MAVQPAAITKKKCCKKEPLLWRSYKRCYSSHIAVFFSIDDIFIVVGFWSAAISKLSLLKHIYCSGFMSCRGRMLQKTIPITAVLKNAAICDI